MKSSNTTSVKLYLVGDTDFPRSTTWKLGAPSDDADLLDALERVRD